VERPGGNNERDVESVAALAEPTRRQLYRLVADSGEALSREQAAEQAGIAVHTAKFHLDKLVEEGLLEVEFHKLSGRTGPGSGRPTKHYRRADREIAVALPPRHYDLLSRILANAIVEASSSGEPAASAASRVAYSEGRSLGSSHRGSAPGTEADFVRALVDGGYEPHLDEGRIVLRNCPFHRAAAEQTDFVCGLNLDYVTGVRDALDCARATPSLDPHEGRCCVLLALDAAGETPSGPDAPAVDRGR
jgi:predicted ArsR family transcriptional regulator